MSVRLFTSQSPQPYIDLRKEDADLIGNQGTFKRAEVTDGTWIFYTYANYNDAQYGGRECNYKILEAKNGSTDISDVNGSLRFVPDQTEGVVLYEHYYYGGTEKWVEDQCNDLNNIFPANTAEGVSSAIVLSTNKTFEAFRKRHYEGLQVELKPGQRYPTSTTMGLGNDKMQSIRTA